MISKRLKVGLLVLLSCTLIGSFTFYAWHKNQGPHIENFIETRDGRPILDLFNKDRYWLTANPDTSLEIMFKYRSPNQDPLYRGKLQFRVLREVDQFIGFVAYYMETAIIGKVLFVAVDPLFRGKHYGEQLLIYAIKELQQMGAAEIRLVTRTTNYPAQKLYTRVGFVEKARDPEGYVFYSYYPKVR